MKAQWMVPVKESFLSRQDALFPLCFVFSYLLNIVFFYAGLAYEENILRECGFIVGCVLFAVFCGLAFLNALRKERLAVHKWLLLGAVMLVFVLCYGAAFWTHGLKGRLVYYAEQFIVFCIPAFFVGICGALRHSEESFFTTLESFSFLAFPGALIYFNSTLFNCLPWNYGADLGILNYMSLAYTFMPFLLAHMICFVERADWTLPFTGKKVRRPQLLRGVFIAVYWVAIIASATRGAYVCVAGFCALLVLFKLIRREAGLKPAFWLSAIMALVLLFNLFIYAPPGLYRVQRMNLFLDALKEHQLVTSSEPPSISDRLDEMVGMDGDRQVINLPEDSEDPNSTETLQISDRGTLFKLAFKEFQKSPLLGMGPMGYTVKYGEYPHNIVLEMLCELGVAGTLVLLLLICVAIVKVLIAGWRNTEIQYIFLFFMAYAIRANISGSLWDCPALLCALGYGITISLPRKQTKQ